MNARELVEWAGRLPWRMVENFSDEDRVEDADGDVVMMVGERYGHWNTDQNDRDLILRATRAFLPMVEALERVDDGCQIMRLMMWRLLITPPLSLSWNETRAMTEPCECYGCKVRAALAIANGEDQ